MFQKPTIDTIESVGIDILTPESDQVEYLFSMGLIVIVSIMDYGKNGVGHSFHI